jgi:hypothetical protein
MADEQRVALQITRRNGDVAAVAADTHDGLDERVILFIGLIVGRAVEAQLEAFEVVARDEVDDARDGIRTIGCRLTIRPAERDLGTCGSG